MLAEALSIEDGTALARWRALTAEVPSLEKEVAEPRSFHFQESQDEWWHAQLVRLERGLKSLGERLALAERSVLPPENAALWSEAIAAIEASRHYRGLQLTPQLGLVPIGPDPDSGFWEFAHLGTGSLVRRGVDGKIELEPKMGLVLILLPGGLVPVDESNDGIQDAALTRIDLHPFFLSKFEMTIEQWDRIGGHRRSVRESERMMLPASGMSWDACRALLQDAGWLRLPSEAQWEYGCRAGTQTRWWTGEEEADLRHMANIDSNRLQTVGKLMANAYGLHDVHGNVSEWCSDSWPLSIASRRPGDGLFDDPGTVDRVFRGGDYWLGAPAVHSSVRLGSPRIAYSDARGLRPARDLYP